MKIKMDSLVITEYCVNDKRKYRFLETVSCDPLINQFVSYSIDQYIEESEGSQELKIGPAYIIADDRKLVGLIRLAFMDSNGILNLHYAVHPSYRREHYGTKILREVPDYLLKNFTDINTIELYIKEINQNSRKCASNAGFILERDYTPRSCNGKIMVYTKKR